MTQLLTQTEINSASHGQGTRNVHSSNLIITNAFPHPPPRIAWIKMYLHKCILLFKEGRGPRPLTSYDPSLLYRSLDYHFARLVDHFAQSQVLSLLSLNLCTLRLLKYPLFMYALVPVFCDAPIALARLPGLLAFVMSSHVFRVLPYEYQLVKQIDTVVDSMLSFSHKIF